MHSGDQRWWHNTTPQLLHGSVCKTLLSTLTGVPRKSSLLPCCHSSICQAAAENTTDSIAAVLGQNPACSKGCYCSRCCCCCHRRRHQQTNKQTLEHTHSTVTCWHLFTQPTCLKSTHTCKNAAALNPHLMLLAPQQQTVCTAVSQQCSVTRHLPDATAAC